MSFVILPEDVVVIDLETSGLIPRVHGIVEIGAVKLATGEEFQKEVRLHPYHAWSDQAAKINGLTMAQARDDSRPRIDNAMRDLYAWLGKKTWTIAGSNPAFDRDFLKEDHPGETYYPFNHRVLDLQTLAWGWFVATGAPMPASLSADAIYQALGLPVEKRPHTALEGARREAHAFITLLNRMGILYRHATDAGPAALPEIIRGAPFNETQKLEVPCNGF